LIDEDGGVRAGCDLRGDLGEMQVHRLGVAARHDEGGAFAILRTDRAEETATRNSSKIHWQRSTIRQRTTP
jgi:hypothetical protein